MNRVRCHQLFVTVPEIEQVELAGIVHLGAGGKAELGAERGILILDRVRHGLRGLGDQAPPVGDGDREEQNRQQNCQSVLPYRSSDAAAVASPDGAPRSGSFALLPRLSRIVTQPSIYFCDVGHTFTRIE